MVAEGKNRHRGEPQSRTPEGQALPGPTAAPCPAGLGRRARGVLAGFIFVVLALQLRPLTPKGLLLPRKIGRWQLQPPDGPTQRPPGGPACLPPASLGLPGRAEPGQDGCQQIWDPAGSHRPHHQHTHRSSWMLRTQQTHRVRRRSSRAWTTQGRHLPSPGGQAGFHGWVPEAG